MCYQVMAAVRVLGASLLDSAAVDERRRFARRERGLHFHPGHLLELHQIGLRARRSARRSRSKYQGGRAASDQHQQEMRNRINNHVFLLAPKKHKLVTGLTENRQFHKFIIITIILPFSHDSEVCLDGVAKYSSTHKRGGGATLDKRLAVARHGRCLQLIALNRGIFPKCYSLTIARE